eukprot:jgi/Chrzof1/3057/Cz12g10050.t1
MQILDHYCTRLKFSKSQPSRGHASDALPPHQHTLTIDTGNDILEFTAFDNRKQTAKTAAAALALRYFEKYFGLNLETVKREHVASFEYAWGSMPQPPSKVTRTLQDDNTLPRTLRNLEAVLQSGQVGYRKASWNQEFGYDVQLTQQRRSGEYTCIVSIHIRVFKPGQEVTQENTDFDITQLMFEAAAGTKKTAENAAAAQALIYLAENGWRKMPLTEKGALDDGLMEVVLDEWRAAYSCYFVSGPQCYERFILGFGTLMLGTAVKEEYSSPEHAKSADDSSAPDEPPAVSSSRGGGVKHELTGETVGDPVHMEITEGTGRIVWIDMLTTGHDPYRDVIVQAAGIVTDQEFNIVQDTAHPYIWRVKKYLPPCFMSAQADHGAAAAAGDPSSDKQQQHEEQGDQHSEKDVSSDDNDDSVDVESDADDERNEELGSRVGKHECSRDQSQKQQQQPQAAGSRQSYDEANGRYTSYNYDTKQCNPMQQGGQAIQGDSGDTWQGAHTCDQEEQYQAMYSKLKAAHPDDQTISLLVDSILAGKGVPLDKFAEQQLEAFICDSIPHQQWSKRGGVILAATDVHKVFGFLQLHMPGLVERVFKRRVYEPVLLDGGSWRQLAGSWCPEVNRKMLEQYPRCRQQDLHIALNQQLSDMRYYQEHLVGNNAAAR